ncbi:MAG: ferritin-like domain-containing protein, partial [Chitinophagales bacterium]
MHTSQDWINHFQENASKKRIDFSIKPTISKDELKPILLSLQAWQLGETSDGFHLLKAATLYASKIGDPDYTEAVRLFIKEEQKHGNNLGFFLDAVGAQRIKYNWGDELFRRIRYFNTSMEIWTMAVITVESTAQIFYQAIKDASTCQLLRQICTDILVDEADHIRFQSERLAILFQAKGRLGQRIATKIYPIFFMMTAIVVWMAHKNAFRAGGLNISIYYRKMQL